MEELVAQACRDYCPATRLRAMGTQGGFRRRGGGEVPKSSMGRMGGSHLVKDFQSFTDPKKIGQGSKMKWLVLIGGQEPAICYPEVFILSYMGQISQDGKTMATVYLACCLPSMLSTWHAVYMAYFLPGRFSTWHAVYLTCCLPCILSTCHAVYLARYLPGMLSSWHAVYLA